MRRRLRIWTLRKSTVFALNCRAGTPSLMQVLLLRARVAKPHLTAPKTAPQVVQFRTVELCSDGVGTRPFPAPKRRRCRDPGRRSSMVEALWRRQAAGGSSQRRRRSRGGVVAQLEIVDTRHANSLCR